MSLSDIFTWAGLLTGEVYLIYLFEHNQIGGLALVIVTVIFLLAGALTTEWAKKRIWLRQRTGSATNEMPDSPLLVHWAKYGVEGHYKDVTMTVKSQILNNRITGMPITNTLLGPDPCSGVDKHFIVSYSFGNGSPLEIVKKENMDLYIPELPDGIMGHTAPGYPRKLYE